eukprot:6176272-Pleurochrysis_carterae.AAC.2
MDNCAALDSIPITCAPGSDRAISQDRRPCPQPGTTIRSGASSSDERARNTLRIRSFSSLRPATPSHAQSFARCRKREPSRSYPAPGPIVCHRSRANALAAEDGVPKTLIRAPSFLSTAPKRVSWYSCIWISTHSKR